MDPHHSPRRALSGAHRLQDGDTGDIVHPRVDKNLWTVEFTTKIKASPHVRRIGFPVPRPSDRVFIRDTQFDGKGMALTISRDPDGYIGHWRGRAAWDRTAYFKVILETVEKEYPQPGDDFSTAYNRRYDRYLTVSDLNAQELEDLSRIEKDIIPDTKNKTKLARAIYYFVYEEVLYNGNKRHTPIGQVLETLEASSWGKSKLFTVLCRRQGIPARMVGGIILRPQQEEEAKGKRKFFFWNEAYLDGNGSRSAPHTAISPGSPRNTCRCSGTSNR
jgi:transglutaminase-like putative cysteine protease